MIPSTKSGPAPIPHDSIRKSQHVFQRAKRENVDRTPTAHHFFRAKSCCTDLFLLVVRVYSHTLTPCACMAQGTKHIVCVSPKNTHTSPSSRNVVHLAALDDTTHGHSFLTFS